MIVTILPMSRGLYKFLDELERGNFGSELVSIALTGFIKLMVVRNFNLKQHLTEVDEIDDIFGFEARDIKMDLSLSITRMTLTYRNYFESRKFKSIKVYRCSYNKYTLRFAFEVCDDNK